MLSIRAEDVASIAAVPEPVGMTQRLAFSLEIHIAVAVSRVGSRQPVNRQWRGLDYVNSWLLLFGGKFAPLKSLLEELFRLEPVVVGLLLRAVCTASVLPESVGDASDFAMEYSAIHGASKISGPRLVCARAFRVGYRLLVARLGSLSSLVAAPIAFLSSLGVCQYLAGSGATCNLSAALSRTETIRSLAENYSTKSTTFGTKINRDRLNSATFPRADRRAPGPFMPTYDSTSDIVIEGTDASFMSLSDSG